MDRGLPRGGGVHLSDQRSKSPPTAADRAARSRLPAPDQGNARKQKAIEFSVPQQLWPMPARCRRLQLSGSLAKSAQTLILGAWKVIVNLDQASSQIVTRIRSVSTPAAS